MLCSQGGAQYLALEWDTAPQLPVVPLPTRILGPGTRLEAGGSSLWMCHMGPGQNHPLPRGLLGKAPSPALCVSMCVHTYAEIPLRKAV